MKRHIGLAGLVAACFLGSWAVAQQAPPVFRGSWTATVGAAQVFRGSWTGQALPHQPNTVQGSWTLLGDTGQVVAEGTWRAQKTSPGWQGSFTARVRAGGSYSGTWRADVPELSGKTFQDMLKQTREKQVAGWWRTGRYQGNWWLKGAP